MRNYRILVAQTGRADEDLSAKTLSRRLRDLGYEVIFTGPGLTPENIAAAAGQEDVDAICLWGGRDAPAGFLSDVAKSLASSESAGVSLYLGGETNAALAGGENGPAGLKIIPPQEDAPRLLRFLESEFPARRKI